MVTLYPASAAATAAAAPAATLVAIGGTAAAAATAHVALLPRGRRAHLLRAHILAPVRGPHRTRALCAPWCRALSKCGGGDEGKGVASRPPAASMEIIKSKPVQTCRFGVAFRCMGTVVRKRLGRDTRLYWETSFCSARSGHNIRTYPSTAAATMAETPSQAGAIVRFIHEEGPPRAGDSSPLAAAPVVTGKPRASDTIFLVDICPQTASYFSSSSSYSSSSSSSSTHVLLNTCTQQLMSTSQLCVAGNAPLEDEEERGLMPTFPNSPRRTPKQSNFYRPRPKTPNGVPSAVWRKQFAAGAYTPSHLRSP